MRNMEQIDTEYAAGALRNLIDFVNKFGCPDEIFAKLMMREHRTLQQSAMRLFMKCIEQWAIQEHSDLRNEATIALCKKIMKSVEDDKYLPFI